MLLDRDKELSLTTSTASGDDSISDASSISTSDEDDFDAPTLEVAVLGLTEVCLTRAHNLDSTLFS